MGRQIVITTQMRVGSTWLCDLVAGLLETPWRYWEAGRSIPLRKWEEMLRGDEATLIVKTHLADPALICAAMPADENGKHVLNVRRDVKDRLVSWVFYWRHDPVARRRKDEPVAAFREAHADLSDRDYVNRLVRTPICREVLSRSIADGRMYQDFRDPRYWRTSYEALCADAAGQLRELCRDIGLRRSDGAIGKVVEAASFRTQTGRSPGEGNNRDFRRSGTTGDHRKWLSAESIARIDDLIERLEGDGGGGGSRS